MWFRIFKQISNWVKISIGIVLILFSIAHLNGCAVVFGVVGNIAKNAKVVRIFPASPCV